MARKKGLKFEVTPRGCFVVTSHKPESNGYVRVGRCGRRVLAHRLVFEECFGELPDWMLVLHECDNRPCINPEHLKKGTHLDNNLDCVVKGRNNPVSGPAAWNFKLPDDGVEELKAHLGSNCRASRNDMGSLLAMPTKSAEGRNDMFSGEGSELRERGPNGRFLAKKRTFPRSTWKPEPGPVVLVGSSPKTSPFAASDAELVSEWLMARYGLRVVFTLPATPTQAFLSMPCYGWKRINVQH